MTHDEVRKLWTFQPGDDVYTCPKCDWSVTVEQWSTTNFDRLKPIFENNHEHLDHLEQELSFHLETEHPVLMTHDELLTKIDVWTEWCENSGDSATAWIALRAVVELHKPFTFEDGKVICDACEMDMFGAAYTYPCPTIQTIEKELK